MDQRFPEEIYKGTMDKITGELWGFSTTNQLSPHKRDKIKECYWS